MFNGMINVYKEAGYTSHDVVARLRGILKQKKIGHTGTLDPAAEGVLPVCLGAATKLAELLESHTKTYQAVLLLGRETDTQDTTGQTLSQDEMGAAALSEEAVREAIASFVGEYQQIPPMYSALKVDGKKLCDLARAGKEVERQARPVTIYEIAIDRIELPRVWMRVTCSKGTYIRTLCHDIGKMLGCGGCMESLVRTCVGAFPVEESIRLDDVETLAKEGRAAECILDIEQMLAGYGEICAKPEADKLAGNGNPLFGKQLAQCPRAKEGELFRLYDSGRRLIGLYQYQGERHWFKPYKVFITQ